MEEKEGEGDEKEEEKDGVQEEEVEKSEDSDVENLIDITTLIDVRTPQEIMDERLENSLLQSLKTTFSVKKSEFPILTSNLFRVHMVAACPPGSSLDVKKSSYKKLSKYLDKKQEEGLLQIKELTKGVESVVSVNYEHELLKYYRVVKYDKKEEVEKDNEEGETTKYEPPVIEELLTVTANVLKLFKFADIGKGET